MIFSYTGTSASLFMASRAGVDARLGVANAAGGVYGRQVTYDWRDDETDPLSNLAAARDLVDDDGVFAVAQGTAVVSGSAAYLHEAGVPVLGPGLEVSWTQFPNMFSYSNYVTAGPASDVWGKFVRDQGATRAVILESTFNVTSHTLANRIGESFRAAGIEVVGSIDVTPDALNPVSIPEQIRNSGADTLAAALPANAFAGVYAAALDAGAEIKVALSPTGYDHRLLAEHGAELAGTYYFFDHTPFELGTASHQEFLAAMQRYSPHLAFADDQVALTGWIVADMALVGLERAGPCPTRAGFIAALRAVDDYDAAGLLTAPVNFQTALGQLTTCYSFVRVTPDGTAFEIVEPLPYCGSQPAAPGPSNPDPATTPSTSTGTGTTG